VCFLLVSICVNLRVSAVSFDFGHWTNNSVSLCLILQSKKLLDKGFFIYILRHVKGGVMPEALIKEIKEAEEKAKKIGEKASNEAREIIEEARRKAKVIASEAEEEVDKLIEGKRREGEEKAIDKRKELEKGLKKEVNEIKERAKKKMDDTVRLVLSGILKKEK